MIIGSSGDEFIAPACHAEIEVVFQDEHLLLINKPSGLLSLSGKNQLNKDSVHYRLIQQFPSAVLVHRLDFGTSGIMVIALNQDVNSHISKQFENRTVVKTYEAILDGLLSEQSGSINFPILKDKSDFPRLKICHIDGKHAISLYEVIGRNGSDKNTRVRFSPTTGRTHQLRIHSAGIGHPILGCDLYGSSRTHHGADRLLLHAVTLEFDHPVTGVRVFGKSSCPF